MMDLAFSWWLYDPILSVWVCFSVLIELLQVTMLWYIADQVSKGRSQHDE